MVLETGARHALCSASAMRCHFAKPAHNGQRRACLHDVAAVLCPQGLLPSERVRAATPMQRLPPAGRQLCMALGHAGHVTYKNVPRLETDEEDDTHGFFTCTKMLNEYQPEGRSRSKQFMTHASVSPLHAESPPCMRSEKACLIISQTIARN